MKTVSPLLLLTLSLGSCSHRAAEPRVGAAGIAQKATEGSDFATVQFPRGRSVLSEENKKYLNRLAQRATRSERDVAEIKVLAWADREYPAKRNERPRTREVILAGERARVIREFMREDLGLDKQIDVFNMAKKPGLIHGLLKDEEFQVKRDVATSGVTATRLPTGETSYTKAGKVLVIIDYKEVNK